MSRQGSPSKVNGSDQERSERPESPDQVSGGDVTEGVTEGRGSKSRESGSRSAAIAESKESTWSALGTEQHNETRLELDLLPVAEVVELLLTEDREGLGKALACADAIGRAAEWVAEVYGAGGTILFAGAGTSGRLGVLEAAECPPTFNTDPDRIRAVIAGGKDAVFRSQEGAEDLVDVGRGEGGRLAGKDLLIGLSASSVTPYVRGAIEGARASGARTVLVTCAAPEGLSEAADLVIALDTGPEILTGSTRLKAGSATKAVLNAITTGAMTRLGKVYGDLMVDLQPSCAKLEDRARRIVGELTGKAPGASDDLLREAGGRVKVAVVMAAKGLSASAAEELLAAHRQSLRGALGGDLEA